MPAEKHDLPFSIPADQVRFIVGRSWIDEARINGFTDGAALVGCASFAAHALMGPVSAAAVIGVATIAGTAASRMGPVRRALLWLIRPRSLDQEIPGQAAAEHDGAERFERKSEN